MGKKTPMIAVAVVLAVLVAAAGCSGGASYAVSEHDGFLPPVRFLFDGSEPCELSNSFPAFVIRDSFTDEDGFRWQVDGYFFCFDRDFYVELFGIEVGGHRGDIEGVWILSSPHRDVVVTAVSAHFHLEIRTNPGLGEDGYLDFFVERGKHGVHYEAGTHRTLGFPIIANGDGESFSRGWFDAMPVYSGSEGARALRERFLAELELGWASDSFRVEPITAPLENHEFYRGILRAAAECQERITIGSLLAAQT